MNKLLLMIALLLYASPDVYACSCAEPETIPEAYSNADAIFVGKCISAELLTVDEADVGKFHRGEYTFEILESWKGVKTKSIKITTGIGGGDCGFDFDLGYSYLIYANKHNQQYVTGICHRTRRLGSYPMHIDDKAKNEIQEIRKLTTKL